MLHVTGSYQEFISSKLGGYSYFNSHTLELYKYMYSSSVAALEFVNVPDLFSRIRLLGFCRD